ncbi:hypothetical protein [Xylanimonas protaetiae]|uniref:N-acetyltransferase domain-containing protein n=1 Tax=Xylanimonas protaetiae TaxID=2509457 RepID=A0A4P6F1X0_9MICO|nr:hypothetical protein [Xylanimonas protaetiae]QAY69474.1 hypothetical protein ET471_04995 [Xylanimonas protaetiae]
MMWTPDLVLAAAAEWLWLPEGAEMEQTDHRIVCYPAWSGMGVVADSVDSDHAADDVIDRVVDRVRAWGRPTVGIWVNGTERPTDFEDALKRRGAVHEDVTDVLALPLDVLPDLGCRQAGVEVMRVDAMATRRGVDEVDVRVWGQEPLTAERLEAEAAVLRSDWESRTGFRVLATLDGRPASTGGVTIAGPPSGGPGAVARLWGGATVPEARHRGAYRAQLFERLRIARDLGASVALVKGRAETSAPILARAGFQRFGSERLYRITADA